MSQSLCRIYVHLVFSTKSRRPVLHSEIAPRLHAYLATVLRDHGCEAYRVGGVSDHLHIALSFGRSISISDAVAPTKGSSSKWMKQQGPAYRDFFWQNGYAAFSVSPSRLDGLMDYIDSQAEHHQKESFQDELRRLYQKYGITLDERYAWE